MAEKTKKEKKPSRFVTYFKNLTPAQRKKGIAMTIICVAAITILFLICFARNVFGNELADMIYGPDIPNGFVYIGNHMRNNSIVLLIDIVAITVTIFFVIVVNTLIGIFTSGNRRSKTIGSLLKSLVRYTAVIIDVGIVLTSWGVDVVGIIAGVGVLTLVIGLGCQSLIQDIVSGIFIVFDDYYQVGDTVVIDGFRGTVAEVGLRTTKLKSAKGPIKSIANSSIHTVENYSRALTMITVDQVISIEEDIERVEAVIARCLPEIQKSIPAIKQGLFYKGVDGFDNYAGVKLLFVCYCEDSDRFQVTRDLTRELIVMCKNEGINIPYAHFVIDKPQKTTFAVATPEEQEASRQVTNELRGITAQAAPKKKKKVIKKVEESLRASAEEIFQ